MIYSPGDLLSVVMTGRHRCAPFPLEVIFATNGKMTFTTSINVQHGTVIRKKLVMKIASKDPPPRCFCCPGGLTQPNMCSVVICGCKWQKCP